MTDTQVQELLKPRYKVIADYPASEYPVGYIIESETFSIGDVDHNCYNYPHLFKRLEWWKNRTIEELESVKYVKVIKYRGYWLVGDIVHAKFEIKSEGRGLYTGYNIGRKPNYGHYQPIEELEPATEEEYLSFINQTNSK
jgi:hypothetical protein